MSREALLKSEDLLRVSHQVGAISGRCPLFPRGPAFPGTSLVRYATTSSSGSCGLAGAYWPPVVLAVPWPRALQRCSEASLPSCRAIRARRALLSCGRALGSSPRDRVHTCGRASSKQEIADGQSKSIFDSSARQRFCAAWFVLSASHHQWPS